MSKKSKKPRTNYELYKTVRRDWGEIKPITKIIPDKRFKKPKYKGKDEE